LHALQELPFKYHIMSDCAVDEPAAVMYLQQAGYRNGNLRERHPETALAVSGK
jgi:hypothetical protein